ncbi:hypothetical protein BDA96_10G042900 [Sorghum bicolor]|uniref:Uncharacterized protein n=2 Tax=Sorghum bicolor TaxID=4558 RepID=A0A921TZN7_SORBI|nr:hypothetical protein BDA96_10G042900 [Sorghum bicolor]
MAVPGARRSPRPRPSPQHRIGESSQSQARVVWEPVTDEGVSLDATGWNAAVFCLFAANGTCDHLDCQRGPFAVVLAATVAAESTLSVYSSEACAWSERPLPSAWSDAWTVPRCYVNVAPSALVGNTLYFLIDLGRRILGCDLPTGETFVSIMPPDSLACDPVLMTMEDDDGLFSINLMTDQVKKELENDEICVIKVVPYMSFYTPVVWYPGHWNAAVLCAATASGTCDHINCHGGPFIVVAVGTGCDGIFLE